MQLIGINRFPHIIAINWKYFSKKAQDLSRYLLLASFYVTKWLLFPFVIQIDLITSSFSKILGWSIIIQLYAKFIMGDILADTAILANTSKKEPLCSCYKHTSWMGWLLKKEGFVCQENLSTCNNSWRTLLSSRLLLSLQCVCDNKLTPFISENGFGCNVMDSYFSLLNLSFAENYHISIFTTFEKQSMINRLSNPINRNRSAAKISKVMSSSFNTKYYNTSKYLTSLHLPGFLFLCLVLLWKQTITALTIGQLYTWLQWGRVAAYLGPVR